MWLLLMVACPAETLETETKVELVCPEWTCEQSEASPCEPACRPEEPGVELSLVLEQAADGYEGDCACAAGSYVWTVEAEVDGLECVESLVLDNPGEPMPEYSFALPEDPTVGEEACIEGTWSDGAACWGAQASWEVSNQPSGASATRVGGTSESPCYVFDSAGVYTLSLVASYSVGPPSEADSVDLRVSE